MKKKERVALFIHSSNEMFGADRVLLDVVESVLSEGSFVPVVWLPSDVEPARDSVCDHLRKMGVEVRVHALPILRRRYLRLRSLPGLLSRGVALWIRILRMRPDVVYCATSAVLLAAPLSRLAGCRIVVLHMQEIWTPREGRVLGKLGSACTSAIAISEASRRSLQGGVAGRSRTIYNAVADRSDPEDIPVVSHERGLGFLMAGRWNAWKGHATLFAAWDLLEPPPGHLTIVGSPPDVGVSTDVPKLAARLRHPESVSVVGQVDDIVPFIDSSSFMIVPSDEPEPFGLVAIEAFARSRPVIASRAGGILEIVVDGKNGHLFRPQDSAGLANILASVSAADAQVMGREARESFLQRFSKERFLGEFRQYWQELASRDTPGR